jgi:Tfp pilus assembly protein PilN
VDRARAAHLSAIVNRPEFEQAREHQALLKTVARHRPDLLQLLKDLGAGDTDGIVLDSLHFKKGQPVTVTGRADNEEMMWKFQDGLRNQNGIDDVDNPSATPDKKTKKLKFTVTFQYRNFTKKDAAL